MHFVTDMHFLVDVEAKCKTLGVEELVCRELKFQVSGLDSLLVESASVARALKNPIFDELRELDSKGAKVKPLSSSCLTYSLDS